MQLSDFSDTDTAAYPALHYFFTQLNHHPSLQTLHARLLNTRSAEQRIAIYQQAIPLIEAEIWMPSPTDKQLANYQTLFHELEALIQQRVRDGATDDRYHIVIAIPVADRPQQLHNCLQSILRLCALYLYGGYNGQQYKKIKVIIADDSKQAAHIKQNQQLAESFKQRGLPTEYFGAAQQQAFIQRYNPRGELNDILGDTPQHAFFHKGASITRNICYLKFKKLAEQQANTLFQFIDSDQEFQINLKDNDSASGYRLCYGINYFYYLNQLFGRGNIDILTGKVVGDPPVSPAVMASNFLQDIIAFLSDLSSTKAGQPCRYHNEIHNADDAAYHDMADLFGFTSAAQHYPYHCPLSGPHTHHDNLLHFSQSLNRFFDGEHPTRKSYYEYQNIDNSIQAARTIYTGNYVFNRHGLNFFIPFSRLKLRMAGPTLGRLIKACIGERFISANLPMLHKRTLEENNRAEFRAGIHHRQQQIDISNEFSRQFFGDVMLFSLQALTAQNYPQQLPEKNHLQQLVQNTYQSMLEKYQLKHTQTMAQLNQLNSLLDDTNHWWHADETFQLQMKVFMQNMQFNFGAQAGAYLEIKNADATLHNITESILNYPAASSQWHQIIKTRS